MQTIELNATPASDSFYPARLALEPDYSAMAVNTNLDDALATILKTVHDSQSPRAMKALAVLLGYMENLEKARPEAGQNASDIVLCEPYTLTV